MSPFQHLPTNSGRTCSDTRRDIVNLKLILDGEHAEEIPDKQRLLHNLLPFARLEDLDGHLVAELSLNHVVQRVEVNTVVTLLDAADILDA